jgi:hypothetical protein
MTRKRPVLVTWSAALGCALCLSFLLHDWVYVDEGGTKAKVVRLGLGYWLWLLAQLLMVLHGLVALRAGQDAPKVPVVPARQGTS